MYLKVTPLKGKDQSSNGSSTLAKLEGEGMLRIMNLKLAKVALIAKNVLKTLKDRTCGLW